MATAPTVTVEAIEFLAADTTKSALPLLADEQPIASPEWMRGVRSLPAAYVSPGRSLEVLATFVCSDLTIRDARVRALRRGPAPRAIGSVAPLTVKFDGAGRSQPTPCRVSVTNGRAVRLDHVVWQWQVKTNGQWVDTNQSDHEIAVTLAEPRPPWARNPAARGTTLPWWEVLKLASEAAAGATTPRTATSKITEAVYRTWGGQYFAYDSSAGVYASDAGSEPAAFDCAKFLRLLNHEPVPRIVDCSDVATIVSTFAAVLGCQIGQLVIHENLDCHPITLIGVAGWQSNFTFGLHEVAFDGEIEQRKTGRVADAASRIWDGCLEVSGDRTIQVGRDPGIARLPANIQDKTYMRRLVVGLPTTIGEHYLSGPSSRGIGPLSVSLAPVKVDRYLKKVEVMYAFETWKEAKPLESDLKNFDLKSLTIGGWTLVPERERGGPPAQELTLPPGADAVLISTLWSATADPNALMLADLYICRSATAARERVLALLGRFGSARFTRTDPPGQNEVEFTSPDGSAVITSFVNTVLVVRRASRHDRVQGPEVRNFFNSVRTSLIGRGR